MVRRLLLIRHAPTAPEHTGLYIGGTDVPLGSEGLRQAQRLAERLSLAKPRRCLASPLARTRQTAEIIAQSCHLTVETDLDLREVDFGRWEGWTFDEIAAQCPDAVSRWAESPDDFAFPGGESIQGFLVRIRRAADRLASERADVTAVVTHGGVIRAMICHLLGLPARCHILFNVRCASIATIDLFDGKGLLSGLSDPPLAEGV